MNLLTKTVPVAIASAAFFFVPAGEASASLIGDTVNCSISGGGTFGCFPASAVVQDPGVEFNVGIPGNTFINVDLASSLVTLDFIQSGNLSFTIINLTSLDWINFPDGMITGVNLDSNSGVNGLAQGDLTFGPHALTIDLRGTSFNAGAQAVISLQVDHKSVPEPSAVLGLGLLGLGAFGKRKFSQKQKQDNDKA